jgi:hypothetical protein
MTASCQPNRLTAIFTVIALFFIASQSAMAFRAENLMADPDATPIKLGLAPEPGMKLNTTRMPNAVLAPFRFSRDVWPAFLVEYRYVQYAVAVSCGDDWTVPCRSSYLQDVSESDLTIRYVQSSDDTFTTPEGFRVGSLYKDVIKQSVQSSDVYTGSGECVRLDSGWNACFYKDDLNLDPQTRQYRPGPNAKVNRFIK